ncbi:Mak10 subunit, NatC N-terminal acetyltransferase-domain-containing protein [Polychytrium aggregatum]|uniref:Mak10 subunit, NatC N-terminal acetyltransferase-domain-containing protein n=1 Tax=Polychytrium aggregatum TaxID=110093 RepID=UPI0022FE2CCD|nr:Mak10 subunit, NatC N-terminal acetyltransferase-domain-containing protein [Polychytrium aggregatum]KAI9209603.1 Mak10 subunit, NatC N-terminal acetyltransferase-domain-containing protein [Polychytrium aggregatum]
MPTWQCSGRPQDSFRRRRTGGFLPGRRPQPKPDQTAICHGQRKMDSPVADLDSAWRDWNPYDQNRFDDITDVVYAATDAMQVGQLVHHANFTLFEAMSAIEIMDPKMDSGMDLPPSIGEVKLTPDEIVFRTVPPSEEIGIMDELLAREMSWIAGHMLCQTVYTCVFVHRPLSIRSRSLKPYVVSVLKTIRLINTDIIGRFLYDDEDFSADTAGFPLCEEVSAERLLESLKQAEYSLETMLESARSAKDANVGTMAPQGEPSEKAQSDSMKASSRHKYTEAILHRIRFRQAFYSSFLAISGQQDRALIVIHLQQALAELDMIESSQHLAADVGYAFDPLVTRKLFSHGLPRALKDISIHDLIGACRLMLSQLVEVFQIPSDANAEMLQRFLHYRARRADVPNIIVRSLTQKAFFADPSRINGAEGSELIREWITSEYPTVTYFSIRHDGLNILIENFLAVASKQLSNILCMYSYNSARQRRRMYKIALLWDQFQAEAEQLDMELQNSTFSAESLGDLSPFFLSSWVYAQKLEMLTWTMATGFEQEIYRPYELVMVFWYMIHLYECQSEHSSRSDGVTLEQQEFLRSERQATPLRSFDQRLVLGKKHLVTALFQISTLLHRLGKFAKPDPAFYREDIHFQNRFRFFTRLSSPAYGDYSQYLTSIEAISRLDIEAVLELGRFNLDKAKGYFEGASDIYKSSSRYFVPAIQGDVEKDLAALIQVTTANRALFESDKIGAIGGYDWTSHRVFPVALYKPS